jgi:hypothetical protein
VGEDDKGYEEPGSGGAEDAGEEVWRSPTMTAGLSWMGTRASRADRQFARMR